MVKAIATRNGNLMTATFTDARALVIAISDYRSARPLPRAVIHDAEDLVSLLLAPNKCGYNADKVRILLDGQATRAAILSELAELARLARPDETVCIYFSGHGWRVGGSEDSVLMPVEAAQQDIAGTTIAAADFSNALHSINAGRLIVILDACHAGGAGSLKNAFDDKSGISEKSIDLLATGVGRAILSSSRLEETSLILDGARNSAFTTALIEGLSGMADYRNEGSVKLFSLFDYVADRVPALTSGRQHPVLHTKLEQNFAIALNLGSEKGTVVDPSLSTPKVRAALRDLLPDLYPAGPVDQDIWERAGGDLSRLVLNKSGRSMWHNALRLLEHGGGGSIQVQSLISEALCDFPHNAHLRALT